MTALPSITAIIPTFNRAEYLRDCIQSLLAQSTPLDQIIVVNDGSTDHTAQILEEYASCPNFHEFYIPHGGKAAALNLGLRQSTSDYIWICDDDDIADPDGAFKLLTVAAAHPEAGFIYGRFKTFFTDKQGRNIEGDYHFGKRPEEPNIKICFLEHMFTTQFSMIVKKQLYDEVGAFNTEYVRAQDYEMMLRLTRCHTGIEINEMIYYYRVSENTGHETDQAGKQVQWLSYDRKLFAEQIRDQYSLDEYTPGFAKDLSHLHKLRASYLQKAMIFANKAMWDTAISCLVSAVETCRDPLSDNEKHLCRAVVHGKLRWFMLEQYPQDMKKLRQLRRDMVGRDIVRTLTRPLLWIMKNALISGRVKDFSTALHIFVKIRL